MGAFSLAAGTWCLIKLLSALERLTRPLVDVSPLQLEIPLDDCSRLRMVLKNQPACTTVRFVIFLC